MDNLDQRPDISVAHVVLETECMEESSEFMRAIGIRSVFEVSKDCEIGQVIRTFFVQRIRA